MADEPLRQMMIDQEARLTAEINELRRRIEPLEGERARLRHAMDAIGILHDKELLDGRRLTIKELAIRAMRQQFAGTGCTVRMMAVFLRDAWGQDVPQSVLSSQLTRLRQAGLVTADSRHVWHLAAPKDGTQL